MLVVDDETGAWVASIGLADVNPVGALGAAATVMEPVVLSFRLVARGPTPRGQPRPQRKVSKDVGAKPLQVCTGWMASTPWKPARLPELPGSPNRQAHPVDVLHGEVEPQVVGRVAQRRGPVGHKQLDVLGPRRVAPGQAVQMKPQPAVFGGGRACKGQSSSCRGSAEPLHAGHASVDQLWRMCVQGPAGTGWRPWQGSALRRCTSRKPAAGQGSPPSLPARSSRAHALVEAHGVVLGAVEGPALALWHPQELRVVDELQGIGPNEVVVLCQARTRPVAGEGAWVRERERETCASSCLPMTGRALPYSMPLAGAPSSPAPHRLRPSPTPGRHALQPGAEQNPGQEPPSPHPFAPEWEPRSENCTAPLKSRRSGLPQVQAEAGILRLTPVSSCGLGMLLNAVPCARACERRMGRGTADGG